MSAAGVNIEVMYSDHDNQLILVVDDVVAGAEISRSWSARQRSITQGPA
jgi:hypothetical protein